MLVVRPLVLALVRPKVEAGEVVEGLEGLPAAEEQYALYEAQEQEARAAEENAKALAESGEDGGYGLESGLSLDDTRPVPFNWQNATLNRPCSSYAPG